MASGFNLTAQLNLRGPSNIADIVSDIKKQIGSIKADVNLKIDSASIQNVAKLNSGLSNLNKTLGNTKTSATNAAAAIRSLGAAMGQVGAGTVSKDMDAVARAAGKVSKAMQVTSRQTSQAASEMVEFGRVSGLAIRRFAAFSTVTGAVYALTNAINQGVSAYIEYDRQLVKLQQITGESASGLRGLEEAITSLSVGLGVSSADLTDIASTLAQAGLNARDTERALKALALSALAPSFDSMNETVEGSIALMRQFGISASELEQSLGSVNAVAARFAVEASDLITAIQRTGGVFATASRGVSEGTDALNEFLAVFTSVRATTRESAETIATGLRTIFTRIQRGDTIEALKAYGVNLTDLDGKFVGAYKAVELLSKGLSTLDPRDLRFSQIVEELGGFRQIGKVIPLIQQFATAQDALRVAQQGQGSLAEDAAKAQLSLAIQTAKVKQEFLALFREIGKSDSFQTIAKGALSLASGLIKVADSVKGVLPVLGVIMAFKGASAITQFAGGFSRGVRGIGGAKGLGERMGGGGSRMSQGGRVRYFASGGLVPGSGDTDSVPAMLTPGEFVINKKAVKSVGPDKLHKINKYKRGGTVWSQVDPGSGSKTYGYEFSHLDKGLTPTLKRANNVEGVGISNLGVMLPRTMNQLMKSGNTSFLRDEIVSDLRKKLRIKDNQPLYVPKRDLITEISDQTPVELFSSLLAVKMPKNQAPKTRLASNARELDLYKEQKLLADNYSANTSSGARSSKAGSVKGGVADSNLSRTDVLANLKKVLLQSAGALPERLTKDEDLHPLAVGLGTFAQEKWVPELLDIREIEVTGKRARGAGRQSWAAKDFLMPRKEKTIETEKSPYKYIYNDGGLVARFTDGGKTKTRKPKEVFGTGETTFPLRVRKKYAEEKQRSDENIRAKLAWDDYPKDERVTVDESKTQAAFQQPFDRAKFIDSFKQKITRNTLFSRMSDFAKFIGLPQEDLSVALPLQVDFGGPEMGFLASAQFSKGARGTRPYEGYDLSRFGYGESQKQELYGLEKLIETKQKEIKKITKTPTRTFDDGSFSFDNEAYSKANDELRELKNRSFKLKDLKREAEKMALSEQEATASSTGRGTISFAKTSGYSGTSQNSTLYHELTHQLFEGLRKRSENSFDKYKERVASLFSGDNDDLADAFDTLTSDGGYSSADVVYGRSYKQKYLTNMLSNYYRSKPLFDSDRAQEPVPEDITKNLAGLSSQGESFKRAREYRPINPKVNQALMTGKYAVGQDVINKMEDNGKEEFLTTLVQKAPALDQNLQGVLDSTLTELLGGAGIKRQQYAAGGYVQRFADGGVAQRKVGYIDYDVIANPANESAIKRGMEETGVTGPRLYTDHLTQLAVKARKDSSLQKLRAVYGVAGSGKTTLARGQGTDDAKLRKTERFPILSPQDIQRATEVIVLSSSVSKDKLDSMFDATDRTYTLSSTTKEEKDRVRSQRGIRDTTGVGLEGRKPGSTASVSTDTAVGEALLADRLGDRSVVLGRSGSGRTRRKQGNELVEVIKKKIGFTWGGYSPMTAGHESILDAAAATGIAPEDFIYLVGSNEGITPGKEETYRTAIFDQDTRVLLAKAGAGARGATVLPKPRDFEVPQAFDLSEGGQRRKVLVPAKGSSTFVADKTAQETEKYKAAGYNVQHIERTGGISGTMVRQLIKDGNLGELQKVLSPGVYDLISNNIGRIQNRANILPSIIEEVQQTQGVKLADIEKQIKAVGISRIDNKKVATDPEYAAKVEVLRELREKRDQIKSAASFEPHRLLSALAAKEPDKYGLDLSGSIQPNIKSMRTLSAKPQKVNLGGMIQRFEEGGAATELVLGNSVAETAAKNSISKQQAILEHLAAFKGISGVRAAARIPAGERRISSVLRKNNIEQGNDLAEAEQYINQALSARAGAAAARKKDIKRSQKLGLLFGAAGVLGNTFSPIKKKVGAGELKEPVDVYVTSGTLDPKVALRFESILNTDIDKTTRRAAKRVMVDQIMAQAGLGKTLQLDFDKTLAFGADKIDLGPDSKKPKFAAFSDRTKVQEGLGSARLSILGKELVKLTKERPDLLNNMRVVTARPQSTLDLVQSWLSSKGLPIPLSQFTGVGGTSVSEAQVAKLKAAVLAPDSVFVDDNKANINAARQVSKANKSKIKTFRYGLQNVKDDENREGTTKGNIFERVIESLGGPKANKALKGIDFPQGLKSAAKYFGIRGDIPTDAKRTLNGPSTVEDNIVSYLKTQGYKNGGAVGKASRKVDFEKNVGPSPFEVKKTALDYYSLEKSSGFSSREFDELARYAKTNDFSLDEFRTYLLKRKQEKQNKAGLRTDTSALRASLVEGSKTTTDAQRALAESLMGPPDAGYRPMRRYADGGHVAALLTPGEAVISPKLAKKIGYGKLARLNKADQNGMGKFAEGGGVGIVPGSGNSDTFGPVPLEVGTFVIRKKATEALGLTGYNLGGVVQRFEDGGSPKVLPLRPDIISRATVSVDRSAEEAMKKLIAVIKELGIESSNTAKLVNIGGNISYKAAEKAMVADLQRAKTAGGSIDQILAAEQALADVRKAGKADVAKRNVLQNTFASAANLPDKLSAGEAQQQIISMANNRASKQIDTIEQSRVNKNTKTLINEKKTQDYDQIVEDLTRKAMAGSYGPLTAADTAQIEQEASKRVMQRSTAGKYNLTEAEQKDIKSKSVVSDEEKQNIYRSQTLKATSSVTGVSKSELTKSGVGADDIRRYAQESMMDRKTLAQMDAQYRTIRMAELQAAGKTASEAKKLVEQELKDRRAAANAVAKEKGIRGPGGTGIMGAVGRAGLGAYDKVTNLSSRYAQTGMGKFTASMTNNYMAGAAIAALGGQSDNIASLLGGSKETQAGTSARIQSATSTIGAGLTLATSVAGIPGIGPLAAAATLAGTGLMALVGSAKAAADAQKAYADSLKTKKFEDATDLLSKAMDNLSKDVNSLDLQSAALTAVKGYVEASSGTTSVAIDARKKEANQERINKMGTGEYLSSFIFDNSYLQNIAGMKTSEQTTVLGADDYAKIAAKEAPKNEEGNRAALQLLEQEIKKSGNPEETFNKIITEDVFKPLREAMARAKPETLAQIIQIEEKMAKTKDAATIAELQKKKEGIITESARNNKMLEQIKKTDELNRAMEAADKAGRQLARTFESMARSVSQAIGRSKFETESMEDSLPNDGKLRSRRSRDANILENPNAYSDAERAAANKNVANRIYNTGAAGLAPEERKRRQDQADKVEKALGFDSFTFANRVAGAGNLRRKENANADLNTVAGAAKAQMMKEIDGLPEEMRAQIEKRFEAIKADVGKDDKLNDQQKGDEFLRRVQDELGKSAADAAEAAKKMALEVENFATDSLNRFVDATNKAVDAQLKAEDAYRRARDIRTESDVALRETVSGGSIGLGERANIIDARISSMTGGLTDPTQIKGQIDQLNTDMANRAAKRDADLAGATNQEDRLKIETQAASDMAQMSKQIQSSQKALEELANSTDLATAAMNQLQAIQGLQKERLQTLDQVLTSSPQELKKFNESLIRVQQRAMGINPNPSKEARKAYNKALRQSGGNRRVATMAAQEQMAQDRAMDLRTMEQMRAEFVNSKMIGGMSQEDANKMYNQGAANVRGQMAFESGIATGPYGVGAMNIIRESADPLSNPAAKAAADSYNQANQRQATANEALAQQAVEDSKQILQVASNQLAEVLVELAKRIAEVDQKIAKDLAGPPAAPGVASSAAPAGDLADLGIKAGDTPPGAPITRPEPVRVASKGGVIYARLGKLIDFKPQGTDTVPAMLTPGEFVVNAKATAQHLPLLKAINSGSDAIVSKTMNKGGVVYLAEGGRLKKDETIEQDRAAFEADVQTQGANYGVSQEDQQEAYRLRDERIAANQEQMFMQSGAMVDQSARQWTQEQFGSKWDAMTEEQRNAEIQKNLPRFQQLGQDYTARRDAYVEQKGAEDEATGLWSKDRFTTENQLSFFRKERERSEAAYAAASQAEYDQQTKIRETNKSAIDSARTEFDRRAKLEESRQIAYGEKEVFAPSRKISVDGKGNVTMTDWKPGEREAYIQRKKDEALANVNAEEQKQGLSITASVGVPQSTGAAQQADQANKSKEQAQTRAEESKATQQQTSAATAQTQQPQFKMTDAQMYAKQASDLAPKEMKDFRKPRSMGEVQMYREGLARGMTIDEIKYERQQAYLSQFRPDVRASKEKSLGRGLVAPSERITAIQKSREAQLKQKQGGDPYADQKAQASSTASAAGQAAAQADQAKTEAEARKEEVKDQSKTEVSLLESTMTAEETSRYQELEGVRSKGKYSLEDPLSPEERAEWKSLHRKRALSAMPSRSDNAARLALMGIAPQDRTPEQQEEYLRLRYQSDSYRNSQGQKRTISGATADEGFDKFKQRQLEEQYARDDKRYGAITSNIDPSERSEYDKKFIERYGKQQADRQQEILNRTSKLGTSYEADLQQAEAGSQANQELLKKTKAKTEEYKASDRYKEDQTDLQYIETQKDRDGFNEFLVSLKDNPQKFPPEEIAEYWAQSRPGFGEIKDEGEKQKIILSYEKQAADFAQAGEDGQKSTLSEEDIKKYGGTNSDGSQRNPLQIVEAKYEDERKAKVGEIKQREFADLGEISTSADTVEGLRQQALAYNQAAEELGRIKNVDSSKQIEDYKAKSDAINERLARLAVAGNDSQSTQRMMDQTFDATTGPKVDAASARLSSAQKDETLGAYAQQKEQADKARLESEARAKAQAETQARAQEEQSRVMAEQQRQQAAAATEAERQRQEGMWVNSSNPAIAALGWFGGVAESGVRAARGATTAAVGATMNAVSQTGVVDWATGGSAAAAKGKELDDKVKAKQAELADRGVLGPAGSDQTKALAEAQAAVDTQAAKQQTAAGDAFRSVANDAVVAGLQDVANVANAVTAGGAEQLLNQAGGNLGTNIFGRYGDPSAVSQMNERNSQMLKDMGMQGSAFLTDFANTTSALAFEAIPIVASFGATGTSLAGKAGKALSYADNLVSSPGSLVGMGKKALGAVDNVVTGGRGAKALKAVAKPYVEFGQAVGEAGSLGYDFAKPALSAAGRGIMDSMPTFRSAARGIGQGVSDFVGGARMVGDEVMNTLNNPMDALRFTGSALDQEFTGGRIGRAASSVSDATRRTAGAVGSRVSAASRGVASRTSRAITSTVDNLPGAGRARKLSDGTNLGTYQTIADRSKKARDLRATRASTFDQRLQDRKTAKWFEDQNASDLADQAAYDDFVANNPTLGEAVTDSQTLQAMGGVAPKPVTPAPLPAPKGYSQEYWDSLPRDRQTRAWVKQGGRLKGKTAAESQAIVAKLDAEDALKASQVKAQEQNLQRINTQQAAPSPNVQKVLDTVDDGPKTLSQITAEAQANAGASARTAVTTPNSGGVTAQPVSPSRLTDEQAYAEEILAGRVKGMSYFDADGSFVPPVNPKNSRPTVYRQRQFADNLSPKARERIASFEASQAMDPNIQRQLNEEAAFLAQNPAMAKARETARLQRQTNSPVSLKSSDVSGNSPSQTVLNATDNSPRTASQIEADVKANSTSPTQSDVVSAPKPRASAADLAKNKDMSKLIDTSLGRSETFVEGQRAYFGPLVKNKEELIEKLGGRDKLTDNTLSALDRLSDEQAQAFDIANRRWTLDINPQYATIKDYRRYANDGGSATGPWDSTRSIGGKTSSGKEVTYSFGKGNVDEMSEVYFDPGAKDKFGRLTNIQRRDLLAKIEAEGASPSPATTRPKASTPTATTPVRPPNPATPSRPVAVATKPKVAAPTRSAPTKPASPAVAPKPVASKPKPASQTAITQPDETPTSFFTTREQDQLADLDAQIARLRDVNQKNRGFFSKAIGRKADDTKEISELLSTRRRLADNILNKQIMDEGKRVFDIEKNGPGQSFYDPDDALWKSAVEVGIPNQFRTYGTMGILTGETRESAEAYGRLRNSYQRSRGLASDLAQNRSVKISDRHASYSGLEGAVFDKKTGINIQAKDRYSSAFESKTGSKEGPIGSGSGNIYEFDQQGGIHVRGSSLRGYTEIYNIPADEVTPDLIEKLHKLGIQRFNKGGIVYANNGALIEARPQGTDTVPAMLTPGEFVVNRQAAQRHMPILHAINKGYYNQGGIVQHLANGGIVAPQYYSWGGLAGMFGAAAGSSKGKDASIMGLDMAAVQELAKSLSSLKDTFGSLENVKDLGTNLQQAVSNMGQNVAAFGEHVAGMPAELLHNISATVMQHITGIDGAEAKYAKQFQGNMEQVASDHVAKAEYNRQKLNEQNPGDAGQIIRHV